MNRSLFFCLFAFFLGVTQLLSAGTYDALYNKKKVDEICYFIRQQVDAQRKAFIKQKEAAEKEKEGEKKEGDKKEDEKKSQTPKLPSTFSPNIAEIKTAVVKRYPQAKEDDAKGENPKVDVRSEVELFEEARRIIDEKFNQSEAELIELEKKDAEKEYPLYRQGQFVDITFARGNEPRRTYRGDFRRVGQYKLFIGAKQLSYVDLPEYIRARFDAKENAKARQEMMKKHIRVGRYKMEREDALFKLKKQMLEEQFAKNLPRGWVYVNSAWYMPVDLVEDVVKTN